jgi:putative membrane-bound dehydrogenase-like protein
MHRFLALLGAAVLPAATAPAADPSPIKLLFLGDNGHHRPADRFRQLQPVLATRGIDLTYTDKVESLDPKVLAPYDGLVVYANTVRIAPEQEQALLNFVEGGKGFIALHCASYCFQNSPKYVALVGAQFKSHGIGTFRTTIAAPDHPVMKGFAGFESWDETYVHTRHNEKDRTVLEYRVDGDVKEPWTWVRTQGKGRVFYTAWGHDEHTWGNPGFHNLVERGIRWAVGRDPGEPGALAPGAPAANAPGSPLSPFDRPFPAPAITPKGSGVKPFEYVDVGKKIPNYTPGQAWGVQGESFSKMQKPLPAEESLTHLVTPQGFHAELFADENLLGGGKPICMTWDERGRLWVALTVDYPNDLQPPGRGHDRIIVLEDTDGDGRADKVTTFAENLSIPTSILFSRGGAIVFDAGQTVFLKDTDGDGKADVREVLHTGWSLRDTHGGVSNMQYGLDNWVWAMQGYNDSRVAAGGETHAFRQGFFRFTPDGSKVEFVRSTDNNTWGLGLSEEGIVFGSTANHNPSVYMPIPSRYYEAVRGWAPSLVLHKMADTHLFKPVTDRVRQVDHHGGYTAGAGHSLYTARGYPPEYWNRTAFVSDPTGHLTGTFVIRRNGSDFRSTNPFNLVASDDEWTAPIMAEVGPDGNVWVIDWYAYIVQHNPTPAGFRTGRGAAYETDLRDKKHGRIYRVVYDGRNVEAPAEPGSKVARREPRPPDAPKFSLAGASPQKLVETLRNDNLFWRRHAQRLLVERRQRDVLPALFALVRDTSVDAIGLNVAAIHALWTMQGLGALDGADADATAVTVAALRHPSAGVRRNAVQVLPRTAESTAAVLDAGMLRDPDPQVRLLALLALADLPPSPAAGRAVVAALADSENARDRWIPDAATCAAAKNAEHFLIALAGQRRPSVKLLAMAPIVAEHYARGGPADSVGPVIARLADGDPTVAEAVVRGLARGWLGGQSPKLNEQLEHDLDRLAARLAPERRGVLAQLATAWGGKRFEKYAAEAADALLAKVKNQSLSSGERAAAARELVGLRPTDEAIARALIAVIGPRTPSDLAADLLRSLQVGEAPAVPALVLDRLPELTPAARSAGLALLLTRPQWVGAFLDRVDRGEAHLADLTLDQRQALAAHPDPGVRRRAVDLLRRGDALPNADRQKVIDEYIAITTEKGDVVAGKLVFKNVCAKCHTHSGEGERIGPDLTGMAVHPKDHLLTDILDPSRSVESNFRVYSLTTTKGQVLTGLLASESRTAVELIDAEGKRKTVLREEIADLSGSNKSLMPDGFEKQLSRKDLRDLLEFLTARGKYLPLPLDKVATAVSTHGLFTRTDNPIERLVFDDWRPKTIGEVPFHLVDPQGDRVPNIILLHGPHGYQAPRMPKAVSLPCNAPVKAVHPLSGVSGWGYPSTRRGTTSLIVRLHYADGTTEDHALKNGVHFADYIRRVDVPESQFAFDLHGRQIRYVVVRPQRSDVIKQIEFVKGPDDSAPVIMAVTVEAPG